MSLDAFRRFHAQVQRDAELQALARNALRDGVEALVVLARLKGFEFNEDEMILALLEAPDAEPDDPQES